MGRLIDADSLILEQQSLEDVGQGIMEFYSKEQINNAETVEAIPKADYETRLKADLVDILTELQLEIEETAKDAHTNAFMNGYKDMYLNGISASAIKCSEIIQQKINSLKEA